ncbi:MAG TPA: alpha/beta hydrolase [Candidatus Sulfotelmatobacter sp.]|jgi:pimeloyl-[acyl-carrier protein] methyl ester esterase|nr:alpha/beta hydrolase [Candidatus Sulfotelmatobacter sp.]
MAKHLVLLPGMDGTGDLFDDFVAALPQGIGVRVGRYPTHDYLEYRELCASVKELTRDLDEFVFVAESFSSLLAIMFAAENPPNLAALIICAGFASNPFPVLGPVLRALARPWPFRLRPPSVLFDRYIFEASTSASLKDKVRQNLRTVSPEVLAGRAREILNCDARKELAQIKIPMLYLQGENDRLIKARCFEEIQKIRPDVQLASISAPHLVLQHQPDKSAEIILKFCSSIEG